MVSIIDYVPGDTILHRLNPVTKIALAASVIAASLLADSPILLIALLALTLAVSAAVHVMRQVGSFLKLLIPLAVIMFIMQTILMREGRTVFLFMTDRGIELGGMVCLRLLCLALPLIPALVTTKLTDLANACVEVLHVPYKYAFTFTTALRFVPVFSQEMNAIMEAQTARGVEYDTPNPLKKIRLMLPLCVPLLISSVGKTDATALAAEERGFYLRTRTSAYKRYPLRGIDFAALALCVALVVLGVVF